MYVYYDYWLHDIILKILLNGKSAKIRLRKTIGINSLSPLTILSRTIELIKWSRVIRNGTKIGQ